MKVKVYYSWSIETLQAYDPEKPIITKEFHESCEEFDHYPDRDYVGLLQARLRMAEKRANATASYKLTAYKLEHCTVC